MLVGPGAICCNGISEDPTPGVGEFKEEVVNALQETSEATLVCQVRVNLVDHVTRNCWIVCVAENAAAEK